MLSSLDPAKQTRDREEIDVALKRYLDMNRLALQVVAGTASSRRSVVRDSSTNPTSSTRYAKPLGKPDAMCKLSTSGRAAIIPISRTSWKDATSKRFSLRVTTAENMSQGPRPLEGYAGDFE
jgi:hypothetical protein